MELFYNTLFFYNNNNNKLPFLGYMLFFIHEMIAYSRWNFISFNVGFCFFFFLYNYNDIYFDYLHIHYFYK